MTMDKSLRIRRGLIRSRSVLTAPSGSPGCKRPNAGKRETARWGLPKVRVFKLSMKKKKKKKEEGEEEPRELPAAAPAPAASQEASEAKKAESEEVSRSRCGARDLPAIQGFSCPCESRLEYGRTGLAVELPDDRRGAHAGLQECPAAGRPGGRRSPGCWRSPPARPRWPSWPGARKTPAL